jgi:hypothetical protein
VPEKFGKQGIGKTLVQAAEAKLKNIAAAEFLEFTKTVDTLTKTPNLEVKMEMGVINLRKDLFPWYEAQGYVVIGEIRPNDAELIEKCREDMDVCCVLMRKQIVSSVETLKSI